ncbi:MAG: DUF2493 domain-containing protein [Nonomuraea sp.]|nr:DUF2493 domain-containing protein [Nonomuraea sp.]
MRVLVCGSRQWHDRVAIRQVLKRLQGEARGAGEEFVVIHGACPDGADLLADQICESELGLVPGKDLIREPAQWKRYKRAAGPVRNQKMIDDHNPTVVYAFRHGLRSSGTDDMVKRARKSGIPTHVIAPAASRVDA